MVMTGPVKVSAPHQKNGKGRKSEACKNWKNAGLRPRYESNLPGSRNDSRFLKSGLTFFHTIRGWE